MHENPNDQQEPQMNIDAVMGSAVFEYLITIGFTKIRKQGLTDFDAIYRLHDLHHLVWYENLKHFGIAVRNESGKKGAAGTYQEFKIVLIPKPFYEIEQVKLLMDAIQ